LQVLHEAGVLTSRLTPLERPPRRVVARSCCRAAYVRGALLGGGSLSGPRSPHLEIRSAGIDGADFLARIADEEGVRLGVLDRGRHAVAYAKGIETIADTLALAGASGMGQNLFDMPDVGGWPVNESWISSNTVLARVNFVSALLGGMKSLPAGTDAHVNHLDNVLSPATAQALNQATTDQQRWFIVLASPEFQLK
jgi:hypothetical protein